MGKNKNNKNNKKTAGYMLGMVAVEQEPCSLLEILEDSGGQQRSSWIIGGVESDCSRQTTPATSPKITVATSVRRDSFVLDDFFTTDTSKTPATTPNASSEQLSSNSSAGSIVRTGYTPSAPVPIPIMNSNILSKKQGNSRRGIGGKSSSAPVADATLGDMKQGRRLTPKG